MRPRDAHHYTYMYIYIYKHVYTDFIRAIRLKQSKIKGETKRRVRFPREFHNTFLNRASEIALHARFIMSFVRASTKQWVYLAAFQDERGDTWPGEPEKKIRVTRSRVTFLALSSWNENGFKWCRHDSTTAPCVLFFNRYAPHFLTLLKSRDSSVINCFSLFSLLFFSSFFLLFFLFPFLFFAVVCR